MKTHAFILTALAAVAVLVSATPAAAININADIQETASVSSEWDHGSSATTTKGQEQERDTRGPNMMVDARPTAGLEHWGMWAFNNGIAGTVSATSTTSITVNGANGTTYTVDTTNATMRIASGTTVQVGDHVFVQGAIDGTAVVATLVVDGKTKPAAPTVDEKRNAIVGAVTAESGTTLTVLAKNGTSYSVDAAHATILKTGHQSAVVGDIAIGDAVVVQGTVSGSSVTATKIAVVVFPTTSANGGIRGTVTAVGDNTLTLSVAGGTTYTVNTTGATIHDQKGTVESLSAVTVGTMVVVHGDVNGSAITATAVDQLKVREGLFVRIGGFFRHLFGRKGETGN